ncbi:MAG: PD-(D/E)XK nuclease family protein [Gammaproteobacteria bacterium]|nr:PD-(D/E)XK nuclease family protein [Gammaproteobacteria bacterium]
MAITRFRLSDSLRQALATGVTAVTPSYRLAASVLEAYGSAAGTKSWREPNVQPVDVWISDCWNALATRGLAPFVELEILESALEKALWLEAIEATRNQHPLIDASAMAQIAARAFQDLNRWSQDATVQSLEDYRHSEDISLFRQWREHFLARCEELGRITLVEATTLLAAHTDEAIAELIGPVLLLNFYQPPPNYQQLFDALDAYRPLTRHDTLPLDSLPENLAAAFYKQSGEKTPPTRFEFVDQQQEINSVVAWAIDLQAREPDAHIGLLTPIPSAVQPLIERALLQASDANASLNLIDRPHLINSSDSGIALADTALAQDALLVLELNREQVALADFCRLLRSPFIGHADDEGEQRIRCERQLRRHLQAQTTRSAIARYTGAHEKDYACPLLHEALLAGRTRAREGASARLPREWGNLFRFQLALVGWPGRLNTAATAEDASETGELGEYAALDAWESALLEFEASSEFSASLSLNEALSRLRRGVVEHRGRNRYRQQCSLSLYSPAEAAGLSFTHLWLLGFDDQNWPPAAHPNPLIPNELQRELGIPGSHAAAQYQAAKRDLAVVCSDVSDTLIASHFRHGNEAEFRVSNLIAEFPLMTNEEHSGNHEIIQRPDAFEIVLDARRSPLLAGTKIRGGHAVITQQSQCPFQAFIKSRVSPAQLEPISSGLDSRDRGSAVHWALEAFYTEHDSSEAVAKLFDDSAALHTAINEATSSAIDKLKRRQPELMGSLFTEIESERLTTLLNRFLLRDLHRGEFTTQKPETPFELTRGALKLDLRIDRIDTLNDGSVALIDYKTGKTIQAISALRSERPEEMQLPVYYTAVSGEREFEVAALAIGQVHIEDCDYHALSRGANFDSTIEPLTGKKLTTRYRGANPSPEEAAAEWGMMTQKWEQQVALFAREFESGESRVTPIKSKTVCDYCRLSSVCRIKELRRDDGFEDDETETEGEPTE